MMPDDFMFVVTIFALLLVPVVIVLAHVVRRIDAEQRQRDEMRRHLNSEKEQAG